MLTLRDVMNHSFFKDFTILAGGAGLDRPLQAVCEMESPDVVQWRADKLLLITNGYALAMNEDKPNLFSEIITFCHQQEAAGLFIKLKRFINEVPQDVIQLCNRLNFPLVATPYNAVFPDIINEVNALVMNKLIKSFYLPPSENYQYANLSYHDTKVNRILEVLEKELASPVIFYDVLGNSIQTVSLEGKRLASRPDLGKLNDPPFAYKREFIDDSLNILQYTSLDETIRLNWILVPIEIEKNVLAYLVVVDTQRKLDYFEIFCLRLGFTLLSSIYEQVYASNMMGKEMRDELLGRLITEPRSEDSSGWSARAERCGLQTDRKYLCCLMQQRYKNLPLRDIRLSVEKCIFECFPPERHVVYGIINDTELLLLSPATGVHETAAHEKSAIKLCKMMAIEVDDLEMLAGYAEEPTFLCDLHDSYVKCKKAVDIGKYLFREEKLFRYSSLGPLAWIDSNCLNEEAFAEMKSDMRELLATDDSALLLETLKIHLECQCNFKATSEIMHTHTNTIRYRLDKINRLYHLDLKNHVNRLKLELFLQFFTPGND